MHAGFGLPIHISLSVILYVISMGKLFHVKVLAKENLRVPKVPLKGPRRLYHTKGHIPRFECWLSLTEISKTNCAGEFHCADEVWTASPRSTSRWGSTGPPRFDLVINCATEVQRLRLSLTALPGFDCAVEVNCASVQVDRGPLRRCSTTLRFNCTEVRSSISQRDHCEAGDKMSSAVTPHNCAEGILAVGSNESP